VHKEIKDQLVYKEP
jgi:hypothetical protein